MSQGPLSDAKRRLLDRLKRGGSATAGELAKFLELTDVAVRQHLLGLEKNGLVEQAKLPVEGPGRPSMLWSLTELARGLFPDRHAELTVDLIDSTRKAFGEEGVQRVVAVRAAEQVERYRKIVPRPSRSLKSRVEALARLRSMEGYMADVVGEEGGGFLLIEHHCPICDAARCCQGLCSAELYVFRATLGEKVSIERVNHLLSGDDRCVYRIRSVEASGEAQLPAAPEGAEEALAAGIDELTAALMDISSVELQDDLVGVPDQAEAADEGDDPKSEDQGVSGGAVIADGPDAEEVGPDDGK